MRKDSRTGAAAVAWVAIRLTQGKVALIDVEDLPRVSKYSWCAAWMHYDWRAVGHVEGKTVTLHRFVMNAQPGQEVDHINGDGLDCRKSELRFATHSQNNQNAYRVKPGSFKGVRPSGKKWGARIKVDGKQYHLGVSDTPEGAARLYDAAAIKHFGEFAKLNFPITPGLARTGDLQIRNLTLYPSELRGLTEQPNPPDAGGAETPALENVPTSRVSGWGAV